MKNFDFRALAFTVLAMSFVGTGSYAQGNIDTDRMAIWNQSPHSSFWGQLLFERYALESDSETEREKRFSHVQKISDAVGRSWRYDIRMSLYEEATELYGLYEQSGLILDDPFLDDYLQSLLLTVYPGRLPPGRSGSLRVKILIDAAPVSYSLANGTILINSGLVAQLRTEEELLATIAHEMAHIVLDHQVEAQAVAQQTAEELARRARRRANAAAILGAAGGALGARRSGANAASVFAAAAYSGAIANAVVSAYSQDRARDFAIQAGADFTVQQERSADQVASMWLEDNGYNQQTLTASLKRLDKIGEQASTGSEMHLLTRDSTPKTRIVDLIGGESGTFVSRSGAVVTYGVEIDSAKVEQVDKLLALSDSEYDAQISEVLLMTASLAADVNRDFDQATYLLSRVLDSGSAPASAYILASRIQRYLGDTTETNEVADQYLENAKSIAVGAGWELLIEDSLVAIRLGESERAIQSLNELLQLPQMDKPFDDNWIRGQIEKIQ